MGACEFSVSSKGKTAAEAFSKAVSDAQYESGHGGYSGTIAEKGSFRMTQERASTMKEAMAVVDQHMGDDGSPFQDKWGDAGCIRVGETDTYVFFGWASS